MSKNLGGAVSTWSLILMPYLRLLTVSVGEVLSGMLYFDCSRCAQWHALAHLMTGTLKAPTNVSPHENGQKLKGLNAIKLHADPVHRPARVAFWLRITSLESSRRSDAGGKEPKLSGRERPRDLTC